MLSRLAIRNIAAFQDESIEFTAGLNVITGETGAGKTMLLSALGLITGERAQSSPIGPGSDRARVEAEFDAQTPRALAELLREARDESEPLIIARELFRSKPARAFACGVSCSIAQLQESRQELISLTGQHASRALTSKSFQLSLVDSALSDEGREALREVADLYSAWQLASDRLAELSGDLSEKARRAEMLRHEAELFGSLDPADDEIERLEMEISELENAAEIARAAGGGSEQISEILVSELDRIAADCSAVGTSSLIEQAERLNSAREELADIARELAAMSDQEADPAQLDQLNARMLSLSDLRRRFGGMSLKEIREQIAGAEEELRILENISDEVAERERAEREAAEAYHQAAMKLRAHRVSAAQEWERRVSSELVGLAMSEAELSVSLNTADPSPRGSDQAEISLRANPGLEPAPLGKGASGGELSRVHLAITLSKIWSERSENEPSYLFDEIDAGVGGMTAHSVAKALKRLADSGAQVIVITHLSQIARVADRHLVVRKSAESGVTKAEICELESDDEIHSELARLVGVEGSEAGEILARESDLSAASADVRSAQ